MNLTETNILPLLTKDVPRVDSRLLAVNMQNKHHNTMGLIEVYKVALSDFGKVLFQTESLPNSKTGQKERFALLNEDQAFFLVALSRNTPRVVELKSKLVKAFGEARRTTQAKATEYLPVYHELHDQLHTLANGSPSEKFMHMNINKLVNKTAGIEAGQRATLCAAPLSTVIVAQALAVTAIRGAKDHHQAYDQAKTALTSFTRLIGVSA